MKNTYIQAIQNLNIAVEKYVRMIQIHKFVLSDYDERCGYFRLNPLERIRSVMEYENNFRNDIRNFIAKNKSVSNINNKIKKIDKMIYHLTREINEIDMEM